MTGKDCFKAYDIRGIYPHEIDEDLAYRIGLAFVEVFKPKTVVVGRDVRLSSEPLAEALSKGICDGGADVYDIGLCGTEQVYFSVPYLNADGGIMVTASHNPSDYNGMKFVKHQSIPISADSGLNEIKDRVFSANLSVSNHKGKVINVDTETAYAKRLLTISDVDSLTPIKIVVNPGNGCAGRVVEILAEHLPNIDFLRINFEPDGSFPNGVPNPLLKENRGITSSAVVNHRADLGIAWDGDFDRCFFFDEEGNFIESYYIIGLIAEHLLTRHPCSKIIIDPRLTWNSIDIITKKGGQAIISKTGHAFIKERMRTEDAIYGGEMSGHHYFRDFYYCDSGMIPWLMVIGIMSRHKTSISHLVRKRQELFPISGEINRKVSDSKRVISEIETRYSQECVGTDYIDGLSMEFKDWRFNIRCSNTEPLIRLNVEAYQNADLCQSKTSEILSIVDKYLVGV
ncbi:MAG: phosphomannomutase CpsG [Thermodesulfovibrionales bacterium]|nr:phosphomannomutase CpsG [Thermodesulfovibrionales bacterium]